MTVERTDENTLRVQSPGELQDNGSRVSPADAGRVVTILKATQVVTIEDLPGAQRATDDMAFLQRTMKALEEEKAWLCRPHRAALEAYRVDYDSRITPVKEAVERIKTALLTYRVAIEERKRAAARAEAQARADLAAAEARADAKDGGLDEAAAAAIAATVHQEVLKQPTAAGFVPSAFQGQAGRASVRKVWTFEVTNAEEIPRGWLILDEARLRRAIQDGLRDRRDKTKPMYPGDEEGELIDHAIPGIRIFQKEIIAGGAAR